MQPPGVKNGVIVSAAYWLWVDERRAALSKQQPNPRLGERVSRRAAELLGDAHEEE